MSFVEGRDYEGYVWVRAEKPANLVAALESRDGSRLYGETTLKVAGKDWQRLNFSLTPTASDRAGRFTLKLREPGSVVLGHAFWQPGEWGRFKGLPVRRDVAEGLIAQGITVLRYGGSMINHPGYRWKKMIGPRDRRPPYRGTWYPYSSNGWGILDFLDFCETAGFLGIPALNMDETAQDLADFIEYVNGPTTSEWGGRRAADGHPRPYELRYLELGNEERVDENYFKKFQALAEAIWARNSQIILVVGDWGYREPIRDPFNCSNFSGITSLAAHQNILRLARKHGREVWFDVHVGTDGPRPDFGGTLSYIDALAKLAEGAKHRVVIFEFNANNHSLRRALANAAAINLVERDGRIPIATSANCLQPDKQNDNGWNQGLLFLDPSRVWLQPPGYVTQMYSRNYLPNLLQGEVTGAKDTLDVSAKGSDDGRTLVLQVVNPTGKAIPTPIHLAGFVPKESVAQVTELSGALDARNSAADPSSIVPQLRPWKHALKNGDASYTFPPIRSRCCGGSEAFRGVSGIRLWISISRVIRFSSPARRAASVSQPRKRSPTKAVRCSCGIARPVFNRSPKTSRASSRLPPAVPWSMWWISLTSRTPCRNSSSEVWRSNTLSTAPRWGLPSLVFLLPTLSHRTGLGPSKSTSWGW
jgi:hypothetical protein